jgi:hypothetical protein
LNLTLNCNLPVLSLCRCTFLWTKCEEKSRNIKRSKGKDSSMVKAPAAPDPTQQNQILVHSYCPNTRHPYHLGIYKFNRAVLMANEPSGGTTARYYTSKMESEQVKWPNIPFFPSFFLFMLPFIMSNY